MYDNGPHTSSIFIPDPSPWLFFEIYPSVHPRPQTPPTLEIRGEACIMVYRLAAIIYYGNNHFTGVWAGEGGECFWGYDRLVRGSQPEQLQPMDLATLHDYSGCSIHIAIYGLDLSPTPS